MEQSKNTLEKLVKSYFPKLQTDQSMGKEYFFIHVFSDSEKLLNIKIPIPIKTVSNYSTATLDQKDNFNNKFEKSLGSRMAKYDGGTEVWPINFDITH